MRALMKRKEPSRQNLLSCCDEIRPDDGLDPRIVFRRTSERRTDRKLLQLCSEVARTLSHALTWEAGDSRLSLLQVEAVVPAPNSGRLLVTVSLPEASESVEAGQVLERLGRATGMLRARVAAAITRRRVPELAFRLLLGDSAG
jgi:ribosome-binding factor A